MISIIVPIYNVEKYLHQCLDSILAQRNTDFELLLIDDGSLDKSGQICEEYALEDSRIRVFHKDNGGVSSARNFGLENAKGEWVTFIDSDDWVDEDYLANFAMDSDLCVQGFFSGELKIGYENVVVKKHVGAFYLKHSYVAGPYCKLFKMDIVRKYQLRFDDQLSYGEDILFLMEYAKYSRSMSVVKSVGYHYRKAVENSLSVRKRSYEQVALQYSKHLPAFWHLMKGVGNERKEVRGFLKGALCELLDNYDKSCKQILHDNPILKDGFERCFCLWDKLMYLYFPKFAVWQIGVERKIKRGFRLIIK